MAYSIATTDRQTFKACRQHWDFQSPLRMNLEPNRPAEPLWFGTGIHQALGAYYEPTTPRQPQLAIDVWDQYCVDERLAYEEREGVELWAEEKEHFDEMEALGRGMLKHYTEEYAPSVDKFEVVFVEKKFRMPVVSMWKHAQTGAIVPLPYQPEDETNLDVVRVVNYSFMCDALIVSPTGQYYIMEHKTAEKYNQNRKWLAMDEQCGSYPWAIETVMPEVKVSGVLYNTLMKRAPKPLKVLKNGSLSQDKRQMTTYKMARNQIAESNELVEAYVDFLEFLMLREAEENPFFQREVVKRNAKELATQEHMIKREAMEMLDPNVFIYRNPGPFTCNFCPFYDPCVAKYEGGDYVFMLDTLYRKKGEGVEVDRARL